MATNDVAARRSPALVRLALVLLLLAFITGCLGLLLESMGLPFWWALVFVVAITPLGLGNGIKKMWVKALAPNLLFNAATIQQFPGVDLDKLREYSTQLGQAGFVQLADLGVADDRGPSATMKDSQQAGRLNMILRLFAHPEHQCYGYLMQSFARNSELPLTCTLLTRFEDGWRFSTANGKPQRLLAVFRAARGIGTRYPNFTPSQLLEKHLAKREEVREDLAVEIMPIVNVESFVRMMQEERIRQRALVQQRLGIALLFELMLVARLYRGERAKYEWWGEYERIRKQKRGMSNED